MRCNATYFARDAQDCALADKTGDGSALVYAVPTFFYLIRLIISTAYTSLGPVWSTAPKSITRTIIGRVRVLHASPEESVRHYVQLYYPQAARLTTWPLAV